MNLLIRLALLLVRSLLRQERIGPLEVATLRFRVLPNDLDLNLHMNNGRYLTLMDLGRIDLMNRMGLMRLAFRGHWLPVLGGAVIRYHRPLKVFQQYELTSRVACWDNKWFYLEQRFVRDGKPVASAIVKGLVRGPGGSIPTGDVLRSLGVTLQSPPMVSEAAQLVD